MTDLVTKLILDNKQFITNLKNSEKQVKGFGGASKGVLGTLGKFGAALGGAAAAAEFLKRTIRGTQATSDAFDSAMRVATSTVDMFFSQLSAGHFDSFVDGLRNIKNKAIDANTALDALGNTMISFDYFSSKNMTKFNEQYNIFSNKSKTKAERDAALKTMKAIRDDQAERADVAEYRITDAIKKQIAEKSPYLEHSQITMKDVDMMLDVDSRKNAESVRSYYEANYETFMKQLHQFESADTLYLKDENGKYLKDSLGRKKFDWNNKAIKDLFETYKMPIIFHAMLESSDDEWLKGIKDMRKQADAAQQTVNMMDRRMNRGHNQTITTNKEGNKTEEEKQGKPQEFDKEYKAADNSLEKLKNEYNSVLQAMQFTDLNSPMMAALITQKKFIEKNLKEAEKTFDEMINVNVNGLFDTGKNDMFANMKDYIKNNLSKFPEELTNELMSSTNPLDLLKNFKIEDINKFADQYVSELENLIKKIREILLRDDITKASREAGENMINELYKQLDEVRKTKGEMNKEFNDKETKKQSDFDNAASSLYSMAEGIDALSNSAKEWQYISKGMIIAATIAGFVAQLRKCVTPWDYIAASLAGFASISGAVASIAAFAEGGIVQGNRSMGDYNIARVNSGEMILNTRQQNRLWNMINNGGINNNSTSGKVQFRIAGKELVGVLNNYKNKRETVL